MVKDGRMTNKTCCWSRMRYKKVTSIVRRLQSKAKHRKFMIMDTSRGRRRTERRKRKGIRSSTVMLRSRKTSLEHR